MKVDYVYLEASLQECASDNLERALVRYVLYPAVGGLWVFGSLYSLWNAVY